MAQAKVPRWLSGPKLRIGPRPKEREGQAFFARLPPPGHIGQLALSGKILGKNCMFWCFGPPCGPEGLATVLHCIVAVIAPTRLAIIADRCRSLQSLHYCNRCMQRLQRCNDQVEKGQTFSPLKSSLLVAWYLRGLSPPGRSGGDPSFNLRGYYDETHDSLFGVGDFHGLHGRVRPGRPGGRRGFCRGLRPRQGSCLEFTAAHPRHRRPSSSRRRKSSRSPGCNVWAKPPG